ncbi:MAG TPA: glutamate--tRNA ligase family protein, partial [Terriglobales bacterium]|nr:glutamate--tRNA ligase family protein [Terriglobales bacterium]
DHLSNTPKQVALYEALGWPVPEFAHLSTILGSDRERLSKRHGATSIANFRDMGVLPEALVNYLALLGWAPSGGTREIFTKQELVKEFSLERATPSPAIFDFEKLYWLNRHYIKELSPHALAAACAWYFAKAGYLGVDVSQSIVRGDATGFPLQPALSDWLQKIALLLAPSVDRLDQLPERASLIFNYDPNAALASRENQQVLEWPDSDAVLSRFTYKILEDDSASEHKLTPERFKTIVNEVKAETGAKGKELFHPIRIVLTGSHSGPEFDKVIPILEEGSRLQLPRHVLSVRERVEAFAAVRTKAAS